MAKDIAFRIGERQLPPTKAIWSFDIASNDQITVIRGVVEDAWTKIEAFEKTRGLELALSGDDVALKQWIDSYPSPTPTGDLWGRRWRSDDGTRTVRYYFRHTMQDTRPLTISVSIELNWPGRKRGFRDTPLKPPAGYEHVDISFDETYGGTVTLPPPPGPKPMGPTTENRLSQDARTGISKLSNKESMPAMWWCIIVVLIVAAIVLIWLNLKKRK